MSDEYFDALETRDPAAREQALMAALSAHVAHAKTAAPHFAAALADVAPEDVTSRSALAQLPVLRKSDLLDLQTAARPFGGVAAGGVASFGRVYASPGPIYEPEALRPDYWRCARALHAAGFRAGHLLHNCFSYHFTPAGMMFETGAHAIGCAVFAGGVGNSEGQIQAMVDLRPDGFAGTPDFLAALLDQAKMAGADIASLQRALVSGGALPPSLRKTIAGHGVAVLQCYGTADLGLIAYESAAMDGMIVEEQAIVEIVRPGTGDPLPEGEVGEVVVTTLNPDYPLIRFATGDLSAILPGESPCGRTNQRIKGWLGRADQTTKVKGMFVHPEQVAEILRRHPEVARGRLVVASDAGRDVMTLICEGADGGEALVTALEDSLRAVLKLGGAARLVAPGELPNDGKVIDDTRDYE